MKSLFFAALMTLANLGFAENVWVNQVTNQVCRPTGFIEPASLQELKSTVKNIASKGIHIRIAGNGFSVSPIVCSDGYLLSLNRLNKVLNVDLDSLIVKVEGGIEVKDLNEQLAIYGLCLPNQAAIDELSLAGAISTGAHGTGHTGSFSSFVKSLELIDANGELVYLSAESDPEAFLAAKLGLGALGVIYSIEVQCVPIFYVKESNGELAFEEFIENYKALFVENDFIQFSTDFNNPSVKYKMWSKSSKDELGSIEGYRALAWFDLNWMDQNPFAEFDIPLNFVPEFFRILSEYNSKKDVVLFEIGIRFVEQENALLSTAWEGPIAAIHLEVENGVHNYEWYRELQDLLLAIKCRPHWGKIGFVDYARGKELYEDRLDRFIEVKKRLDPNGIFSNDFINQILYK